MRAAARRPAACTALAWLLTACAGTAEPPAAPAPTTPPPTEAAPAPAAIDAAEATITAEDARAHVAFLASDELRGRDTPSPGLERAADYIAERFRALGLEPAGDDGSYMQRYPITEVTLDTIAARLTLDGAEGTALVYGTDFFVFPAPADSVAAEAVFLGPMRALMDPPPAVEGRIAIVVLDLQAGTDFLVAPRRAADAGARGVLYVLPGLVPPVAVRQIAVAAREQAFDLPLPTFGVTWANAQALLEAGGLERSALGAPPPEPAHLAGTLRMVAPASRTEARVPNVAGIVRGSDPELRDEYVVLTAHFDHVGVGAPNAQGDSIYNGADDDASGTAVVLEVAEALAALAEPPARSVLFLAVSGEEKGLLGSRWFAEHPTVPIEDIVANVNMDMVGRNEPDRLIGVGKEYTELGPLAERIAADNPDLGLRILEDPNPAEQAFFRSDHVAFMKRDIPAIFLTTWLHGDYHQPSDEVDAIDADKLARVGRLVFLLTHAVADATEAPGWAGDSLEQVREILLGSPF